ncbi:MAG: helix-turn-helix domain-containing protein [Inquilinus sp.]|uniref:helix-turn-helix domain-containing protein n=1 Tax=Inquilinus sp. TaxID=1932117 RepID=UPI003F3D733F
MPSTAPSFGDHLRDWRRRRRFSQLDLACEADISTRHLSFIETGRSRPSRDMVLHLAERLEVPLRERNTLLVAAGFAPAYPVRPLDDPALALARRAVERVIEAHAPNPALAVDRHWQLVAANAAVPLLLDGVPPALLQPPVNVLRLGLHPDGLAPRIVNYGEWRGHLLERLQRQVESAGDSVLVELLAELRAYPAPPATIAALAPPEEAHPDVVVPFRLATKSGVLSFLSTTTVFGTPVDVTLSELAVESFFPADAATAEALRRLALPGAGKAS